MHAVVPRRPYKEQNKKGLVCELKRKICMQESQREVTRSN